MTDAPKGTPLNLAALEALARMAEVDMLDYAGERMIGDEEARERATADLLCASEVLAETKHGMLEVGVPRLDDRPGEARPTTTTLAEFGESALEWLRRRCKEQADMLRAQDDTNDEDLQGSSLDWFLLRTLQRVLLTQGPEQGVAVFALGAARGLLEAAHDALPEGESRAAIGHAMSEAEKQATALSGEEKH